MEMLRSSMYAIYIVTHAVMLIRSIYGGNGVFTQISPLKARLTA